MRKIFTLARTLLKSGGLLNSGKTGSRSKWLVPILLGFMFIVFAFSVGAMTFGLYEALEQFGNATALLPLAFGATSAVIFFFGIFYVISVMYHADDVPLLLYLPLRPWQILGGKFITLVVYEYIFESFILVPVLAAYAIKAAAGPLFIVYSVLLALAAPVIALSMAAVIIMTIMRFTRFAKNKQAFNYVAGILAMLIAVGFNVLIQTSMRNITEEQLAAIATGQSPLVPLVSKIFPGTGFAADALIHSTTFTGLWNLLLFLLCSAAAVAVFLLLGQLLYFKGVAGVTESSAKRRAISSEALTKETEGAPVLWSYIKKELRLIVRSPIAFIQCVVVNFIWPVLLIVMVTAQGSSLDMLKGTVQSLKGETLIAIIAGAAAFIASSNSVTSSSISREGKSLYFMKYIPVSMRSQLYAKTLTGVLLSMIGVVLLCAIAVYFGAPILMALLGLVLGIPAAAAASFAGILIDAAHPKLDWTNEQQAIKQNMNVLLHMLVGVVFALACMLPVMLLNMPLAAALPYLVVLSAVLCALMIRGTRRAAQRIVEMDV
jgi:ABC-2 type transport system permease protein